MNLMQYIQEVRIELAKVTWPTRPQVIHLTFIILVASLAVGLYVGGLDLLFTSILGNFLK